MPPSFWLPLSRRCSRVTTLPCRVWSSLSRTPTRCPASPARRGTPSTPFQTPSIDMSGNVGFRGTMLVGTGGVLSTDNSTMYYGVPAGLNLVGAHGQSGPRLACGRSRYQFQRSELATQPQRSGVVRRKHISPERLRCNRRVRLADQRRRATVTRSPAAPARSPATRRRARTTTSTTLGHTIIAASMGSQLRHLGRKRREPSEGISVRPTVRWFAGGQRCQPASRIIINGSGAMLADIGMQKVAPITDNDNQVLAVLPFGGVAATAIARENDPAPGTGGATYQPAVLQRAAHPRARGVQLHERKLQQPRPCRVLGRT